MSYLKHWTNLWPTPDKPTPLWKPERGILWRNEWEPCHDHLEGLQAICERCMPPVWEGRERWEEYLSQLTSYMK
jgi:hypothetical protein